MNDRPDSESDPDSPEIAEVRRLLADSRHTGPIPDDVASRLDDVLLDLSAQRSRAAESGAALPPVVPIAAHRRRRAAAMLVAAAAIVVGGVVGAQNLHLSSGASSATSAEDAASSPENASGARAPSDKHMLREPPQALTPEGKQNLDDQGVIVVHPRRFAADARRGRTLLGSLDAAAQSAHLPGTCARLAKKARVVPARYQEAPAALVYQRPRGGSQIVHLYVCGGREPIRSATLPAP